MTAGPEFALSRILEALEVELIESSDEEIAAALSDLGMSRSTKGSAALIDVKYRSIRRHLEALYGGTLEADAEDDGDTPPARFKNPSATSDRSDR